MTNNSRFLELRRLDLSRTNSNAFSLLGIERRKRRRKERRIIL